MIVSMKIIEMFKKNSNKKKYKIIKIRNIFLNNYIRLIKFLKLFIF